MEYKVLVIPSTITAPRSCNHLIVNGVCVICGASFKHPTDASWRLNPQHAIMDNGVGYKSCEEKAKQAKIYTEKIAKTASIKDAYYQEVMRIAVLSREAAVTLIKDAEIKEIFEKIRELFVKYQCWNSEEDYTRFQNELQTLQEKSKVASNREEIKCED